jgi:antitoxin (DNA-binding transcriptional repressor) of toxin-antitoxin stability system
MTMKSIKVSQLKAQLSRYLRMAAGGERILVTDRDDPIAQIIPPDRGDVNWYERLSRVGRLRLGTQRLAKLRFSRIGKPVHIQASLQAVREEPDEVRRR